MTARVQEHRTTTSNTPPTANSLSVGELYLELNVPQRVWTGVPTSVTPSGVQLLLDVAAQAQANASAVQKAGDTMTGPLVLSGQPTQPAQAANKAYVDQTAPTLAPVQSVATRTGNVVLAHTDITDWTTTITTTLAPYAPLASPTLTGAPKAPTPATNDASTLLATTQFVANQIAAGPPAGALIATTPPTAMAGTLWWDSTGGQLYVRFDDGNSQQWVTAANMEGLANAATKADVATAQNNVGRNLIHNPLFAIWQRSGGPWTVTGTTTYTADRWKYIAVSDTVSFAQGIVTDANRVAIGDEAASFMLINTFTGNAGATAATYAMQNIESLRRLAGKTVTVSFWAAASAALKFGVSIAQLFGTGGSPSSDLYPNGQSVTLSTTPTRYSLTFAIPSLAGKTLGTANDNTMLMLWYSSGANSNALSGSVGVQAGTIWIWGVQLEIGSTATPLEKPDPQQDIAKAQRFFQTVQIINGSYQIAGAGIFASATLPVFMRAVPTVAITSNINTNVSGVGQTPGTSMIWIGGTATTSNPFNFNMTMTLSADL